jgi:hypothetical protein
MLTAMDIPVAAGPWLVLGVVLGILLAVPVTLGVRTLRSRRPRPEEGTPATAPSSAGFGEDDLPGFLESPPGSVRTPAAPSGGWTALVAPATPPPTAGARRDGSANAVVLAAMAGAALLLIGVAAVLATLRNADADAADAAHGGPPTTEAPRPGDVSARLTFGGVVLERHAVGVTIAYPRVHVTTGTHRAAAEVQLVTFNCLLTEAPADPVAAGCTRSVPEDAELSAPQLDVAADGDGLRVAGRFATVRRPNGSSPVPTGRVYELTVRAAPADGRAGQGPEPATGLFEIGDDRVGTSDEGPNDITYGG